VDGSLFMSSGSVPRLSLVRVGLLVVGCACACVSSIAVARQAAVSIPEMPLTFGVFTAQFRADGTFSLAGEGWPSMRGTWTVDGPEMVLRLADAPADCAEPARYRITSVEGRVSFAIVEDRCTPRRMILDRSEWRHAGDVATVAERRIVRTAEPRRGPLPRAASPTGQWPSFRGPQAAGVADGQNLPDRWDGTTGASVLWRTPIPGLAHSSPIVWGDTVFVTTAISSRKDATFKPGLYGDGDASDDRSIHRWVLYAIDKRTGKIRWERVAREGAPRNKRHIKSTYASATPATDGRLVVTWFGSEGVHAFDVNGVPLWHVDLGRVDMGAYDIPTYEWGPASSPIIWNGLVILQCDTQQDSFVLALNAETGETVWKTPRNELPSWGSPTVALTKAGPELVTNASNFIRGYDPRSGRERWRLGGSSKITAPTPIFADDLIVVASGRAPERPIFVVRPGAQGDLTLANGRTSSNAIAWSRTARGSYMPTPLAYRGLLYVLANNGVLDAYDLKSGQELYRQRLPLVGSGFSASPVAADGKIYLSNEDGDMLVVRAGPTFEHIATNSLGELLMATPALSEGVMYVRGASNLFAVGVKKRR
jgi:outer membrane protein assembly factor BamB